MTTFKFTLKKQPNSKGKHSIIILFIKDRKNTSLSLGKFCKYEDWSFETDRVKKSYKNYLGLNKFISKYETLIQDIIDEFETSGIPYTLNVLIDEIKKGRSGNMKYVSFTEFHKQLISELELTNKLTTAKIEKDTLRSLQKFYGCEVIEFMDITPNSLYQYETFLRANKNNNASIGIRFRTIRAVYNKAIDRSVVSKKFYPFKAYKISKIKDFSKKEFVDEGQLKLLKIFDFEFPDTIFAKEMFLFSYYSRGINFLDLMLLKKSDVSGDTVSYLRRKTGMLVSFKLNEFTKQIIDKYSSSNDSPFIFGFINPHNPTENYIQNKKKKLLKNINKSLKLIMKDLSVNKNITYYCARHSFATQLKFNNISIDIIKEALGHKDIKSTMSYLNTLPSKKLDKIIEDVLV